VTIYSSTRDNITEKGGTL